MCKLNMLIFSCLTPTIVCYIKIRKVNGMKEFCKTNVILPPFLYVGCIVFGTKINESKWRENYTGFG
jgi:hypothetical protein